MHTLVIFTVLVFWKSDPCAQMSIVDSNVHPFIGIIAHQRESIIGAYRSPWIWVQRTVRQRQNVVLCGVACIGRVDADA